VPPAAALLCLLAAVLSGLLHAAHLADGDGWLARACGAQGSGCAAALESRWAYFPPALPGQEDPTGWPLSGLGLVYFSTLAGWFALVGRAGGGWSWVHRQLTWLVAGGALLSLLFLGLMVFRLGAVCPFCLGVHVANLALLGLLLLERSAAAPERDHPSGRLALASAGMGLGLGLSVWLGLDNAALRERNDRLDAIQGELAEAGDLLEVRYFRGDRFSKDEQGRATFDAVIRPDDPYRGGGEGATMTLVYFSDLECPGCYEFEHFLVDVVEPLFAGHLRVIYKHFPLQSTHPNAETAAWALEAGRLQGRFEQVHSALLERYGELEGIDYPALAGELGLDPERFERDMASPAVRARVAEDERLGESLGVDATPTVFLNRREVDSWTRHLPAFWRLRAEALRRARAQRGQDW
jgi:uncharacterized membrane protein